MGSISISSELAHREINGIGPASNKEKRFNDVWEWDLILAQFFINESGEIMSDFRLIGKHLPS